MSYVTIPAQVFRDRLNAAGFIKINLTSSKEEVYQREHHKDPRYLIRIYSSIPCGDFGTRGCGKDAIRVVVIFQTQQKTYGIWKGVRVHRTGTVDAVIERTLQRARDGYGFVNQRIRSGQ